MSSTGSANVMMIGAATPTVVPFGMLNEARMVFAGLMVASVPVNGGFNTVGIDRGAVEGVRGVVGETLTERPGRAVLGDRAGDLDAVIRADLQFLDLRGEDGDGDGVRGTDVVVPNLGLALTRTLLARPALELAGASEASTRGGDRGAGSGRDRDDFVVLGAGAARQQHGERGEQDNYRGHPPAASANSRPLHVRVPFASAAIVTALDFDFAILHPPQPRYAVHVRFP